MTLKTLLLLPLLLLSGCGTVKTKTPNDSTGYTVEAKACFERGGMVYDNSSKKCNKLGEEIKITEKVVTSTSTVHEFSLAAFPLNKQRFFFYLDTNPVTDCTENKKCTDIEFVYNGVKKTLKYDEFSELIKTSLFK